MTDLGWAKGIFSDELNAIRLKTLNEELKGKNVPCLDGFIRTVVSVHYANGYAGRLIINEGDPAKEDGHFISILVAAAVITKKPLPSSFAIKHFERSVRAKYPQTKDGVLVETPPERDSKIIVPGSRLVTPRH
jgi:hypothetical protein